MYLPVIIATKNDETTASWIRRLTLANGFDNTEEFAQQFICDSDIANEQRFKAMLGTEDFISLYKALNLQGVSMWDLYMKTSCYGGIAPFLSDARQTHYLNTAFRLGASNNSIVSASNSLTSELRFCPLCKKEDEVAGGWYYHRAHQMPSIKVCYKHGAILRRFTGKFGTELSASPQSVSCTNTEDSWEQDFAVFAKELLDAAPDILAENTKVAVLREVKRQGFYAPASEYAKLNTALKNAGVYIPNLSRLFVQMYDMNYVAVHDLMRLCWFLFGTADKFISACKQVQKPQVALRLPEGYAACSSYHRNIMEFEHSCGTRFCINPAGFMNGWQCPVCDGVMPLQQQYEKIVQWAGHGDYMVEGKFKGMKSPVILRHKCGRTIHRPARDFVYDGARCICESTRTFEEMQDKIQSYGDFELLKYDPKTERVQIHHKGCGRNFEIGYVKFLKVPVCKVCQPAIRNNETFKREIKELVGDEYELVGEYSDKDTKVVLRHKRCGTEQEYKVAHFLRGQRCSKCSRDIPIPRFAEIVSERSCGRYQFIKMKTQNQALLLDTETKKEICMERYYALQELLRPTPSEILPCEHPAAAESLHLRKSDAFLLWLRENYTADAEMTMEDMTRRSTLAYSEIKRVIQSLKDDGLLVWIRKGTYCFPEHAAHLNVDGKPITKLKMLWNWIKKNYSAKEVITSEALREQSKDYLSPETLKQVIIRMRKQGLLLTVDRGKYICGDVKE